MKHFLIAVEYAGLYSTINTVSFVLASFLGILHGKKIRVKLFVVTFAVVIERIISGPLATAIIFVENGFVSTGKQNGVVVFAFVPLLGFLLSKILRKSYKELWDVMMPVPLMMFVGARIACTIAGCCRGYACDWGIYNVKTGGYVFPIQLLEALVTVLILVYVFLREKKNKFVPDGRNVPIILITYGIARFFLEFLHDNEKIVLGVDSMQFHCIFMILVGIVTLLILRRGEKNASKIVSDISQEKDPGLQNNES